MRNQSIIFLFIVALSIVILLAYLQNRENLKNVTQSESITNPKENEFCGTSTYGRCEKDEDCIRDGCSGQVCRSIYEKGAITTCEWRDCYDASRYGVSCRCVNKRCQWI